LRRTGATDITNFGGWNRFQQSYGSRATRPAPSGIADKTGVSSLAD